MRTYYSEALCGVLFGLLGTTLILQLTLLKKEENLDTLHNEVDKAFRDAIQNDEISETNEISDKGRSKRTSGKDASSIIQIPIKGPKTYDSQLLKDIRGRRLLLILVLSDSEEKKRFLKETYESEIEDSSTMVIYQKNEVTKKTSDTKQPKDSTNHNPHSFHDLQKSLHKLCLSHQNDFKWFLLTPDTALINHVTLSQMLQELSGGANIVIGSHLKNTDDTCSLDAGILIYHSTMSKLCASIDQCHYDEIPDFSNPAHKSELFHYCVKKIGISCFDFKQIQPGFFSTMKQWHVMDAANKSLVGIINEVETLDHMKQIKSFLIEQNIDKTKERLKELGLHLSDTLKKSKTSRRSTSPFVDDRLSGIEIPNLNNSTKDAFYTYVDEAGFKYTDSCKIHKVDAKSHTYHYETARVLAESRIGSRVKEMRSFAQVVNKPGTVVEYQFYFLDEGREPDEGFDRIHQVTVSQQYEQLQVLEKELLHLAPIHFLVILREGDWNQVNSFLTNLSTACGINYNCSIIFIGSQQIAKLLKPISNQVLHKFPSVRIQFLYLEGENGAIDFASSLSHLHHVIDGDSLVSYLPIDMRVDSDFIPRCQMNAISDQSVYFPVPFQRYLPSTDSKEISEDYGFWNTEDFESICANHKDLKKVFEAYYRIFESQTFTMDKLFWTFTTESKVKVHRTVDPSLHRLHRKGYCERGTLTEQMDCMKEMKFANG